MSLFKDGIKKYKFHKPDWIRDESEFIGVGFPCVKCIILKDTDTPREELLDDIRKKMLLECDPPEFEDCIRLDKKCYYLARELEQTGQLSIAKQSLLAQKKREHIMVRMFGHQWWKKK